MKITLWDKEIPNHNPEWETPNAMTFYPVQTGHPQPAVVIFPGGGYTNRCDTYEGEEVARYYNQKGFHAFVVDYRVLPHMFPCALQDAQRAVKLIKANAKEYMVDPKRIFVLGFSAGGHLAAAAATLAKNRPNAAIIGYGVVGNDVKGCNASAPDTTLAVDRHTCPCFLFSSRTDELVPVQNSVKFMQALCEHNIAFESHIYAYGPHGFSTCDSSIQNLTAAPHCSRIPNWVQDSVGWLKDMFGDFVPGKGLMAPACGRYSNGNNDPVLSISCTIGHLLANPEAAKVIAPIVNAIENYPDIQGGDPMALFGALPLSTALGYAKLPADQIASMNAAFSPPSMSGLSPAALKSSDTRTTFSNPSATFFASSTVSPS